MAVWGGMTGVGGTKTKKNFWPASSPARTKICGLVRAEKVRAAG